MKPSTFPSNLSCCLAAMALISSAVLTGCGAGSAASSTPGATVLPAIQGRIMGGETPIAGSKITLWVTDPANSGYGVATNGSTTGAQPLQTVTGSNPGGNFSFTTGYTCPAGQFIYLTSTGGDVSNGSSITNNNVVLVAALGSCSNFSTSTQQSKATVLINEVSTVAAAYALDGFTTVNASTAGSQKVYIGAPANNNATTGACTGTGSAMACTAAGLSHAFANALALSDTVHLDGSFPTGLANQTVPGNANGSIPQAEIHGLANIMSFCTNSAGTTSGAGDGTNCGTFFADATPTGATAPSDTFSAMMNIARAPYNNVGTTCTGTTGGLFCLAGSSVPFNPAIAAAPREWTIAIAYSGTPSASFGSPQYAALDANDNVYVQTSNSYTSTTNGLTAMTSTGASLWSVAQSTNTCVNGTVTPDALGNVWMSVNATSTATCSWGIYEYSASTGAQENMFGPGSGTVCSSSAPTSTNCPGFPAAGYDTVHSIQSTPKPMAFDKAGNLWYGRASATCTSCLFQLPYTSSSTSFGAPALTYPALIYENQILIDTNQNVWIGNGSTTSGTAGKLFMVYNTGSAASPSYTNSTGYISTTLNSYDNGGIGIDSAGNVWTGSNLAAYEFTPTVSGASSSFNTAVLNYTTTASHPYVSEVDGAGTYFYPSLTNSGQIWMQVTPSNTYYSSTAANNSRYLRPCYMPAGSTTCDAALLVGSTQYRLTGDAKSLQVDSTGAVWMAAGVDSSFTSGYVVQLLGIGQPTWPLYQYGIFGKLPQ